MYFTALDAEEITIITIYSINQKIFNTKLETVYSTAGNELNI